MDPSQSVCPPSFSLHGRLDGRTDPALPLIIAAHCTRTCPQEGAVWILDLQDVELIDSAGIAILVATLKLAQQHQATIMLCNLQPAVRLVFEIAQLDRLFVLRERVPAAGEAVEAIAPLSTIPLTALPGGDPTKTAAA
jgi:anti-anti-sigma factor